MINDLKKVISNKAIIALHKTASNDNSFLVIEEDGDLSDIDELTVQGIPDDAIAFTLDISKQRCDDEEKIKFSRLSHYLDASNQDGLLKACDLVIISRVGKKFNVVLLEQKSQDPSIDATNRQLENSKVFFKYLVELIKSIYSTQIDYTDIIFNKAMASTRVVKFTVNISSPANKRELERRDYLESLNMKEVTIRPSRGKKGSVNFGALVR